MNNRPATWVGLRSFVSYENEVLCTEAMSYGQFTNFPIPLTSNQPIQKQGMKFNTSTYCGYQFSWIWEDTQVFGILNLWFWCFQYTHQWESLIRWEPNFVVWSTHENHENWYPTKNSTFTVDRLNWLSGWQAYLQAIASVK